MEGFGATPVGTPETSANIPIQTVAPSAAVLPQYKGIEKENFGESLSRGFWLGAEGGGKKSNVGSTIGGALTEFVRVGTDASLELFSEERKQLRRDIDTLRAANPELATQIEETIGRNRTAGEEVTRLGAALGEGILTVTPIKWLGAGARFAGAGRLLDKVPGGAKVADALGMGERALTKIPGVNPKLAKHMTTGFAFGGSYGFLAGLQQDADLYDALKGGAIGGVSGMGLALGGTLVFKAGEAGLKGLDRYTKIAKDLIPQSLNPGRIYLNTIPPVLSRNAFLQSIGGTMKTYYGDVGKEFLKLYEKAGQAAAVDIGKYMLKYVEAGLMKAPAFAGRLVKDVKYVGDDPAFYREADKILRGEGMYANPAVQQQAIQADERLMLMDITRKNIGAMAQRDAGVSLLDPDKYLPKNTPVVDLKVGARERVANSLDEAEQLAIYRTNSEIVKDMVEAAFDAGRGSKTLLETYRMYYDYTDVVTKGGRVGLTNNRFLQDMVRSGKADSIEEAKGKILQDMQFRRASLTPRASSLDYSREVDLPWYDPNPARTLPVYVSDSITRLNYAKNFGRNDEVIKTMLSRINSGETRSSLATAEDFSTMVNLVTGQIAKKPGEEAISAWIRAANVFKLSTAAIVQVGQHLNTLLSSDFKSLGVGLKNVFTDEGMREVIESGAMTNAFIREMHAYNSGGGTKVADKFLTMVGMTHTDLFNRAVSSLAAKKYAQNEFSMLLKRLGVEEADERTAGEVGGWLREKEKFGDAITEEGMQIQRKIAEDWNREFPGSNVSLHAGDIKTTKKTLKSLDGEYSKNIGTLQKTKKDLQNELLAATDDYTAEGVASMVERVRILRQQLKEVKPKTADAPAVPSEEAIATASIDDFDAAIVAGLKLREEKLGSIINHLEDAIEDAKATPLVEEAQAVTGQRRTTRRVPETPEEKAARVNNDIEAIDSEILRLTNEQADKTRLLDGMVDAYDIAERKLGSQFPGAAKYDARIAERKTTQTAAFEEVEGKKRFRSVSNPEMLRLKELGIDVEEAVARGYLDRDDILTAGFNMSKNTQFLSRPVDLPGFAQSPWGKVVIQFRTFVIQQGDFLKRTIVDDLSGKGDFKRGMRNLVILGTVFPMTGEVIADVRSLVTGRNRPTEFWDRYFDNITSVGGTALAFDAFKSAEKGRFLEFMGGPGVVEFSRFMENSARGVPSVVTGDESGLNSSARGFVRQGLGMAGLSAVTNRVDWLKSASQNEGESAAEMMSRILGL